MGDHRLRARAARLGTAAALCAGSLAAVGLASSPAQAADPLCYGQMNAQWRFGQLAGADFTTAPVTYTDSAVSTLEGVATIADANGELLFYTDGSRVWNRDDVVMPNGSGLIGNSSATQAALIVPRPGTPGEFYVLHADQSHSGPGAVSYSVVDIDGDGGLGEVTTKNVPLTASTGTPVVTTHSAEKLTGVAKADGTEAWVVTAADSSATLFVWSVTAGGISLAGTYGAAELGAGVLTFSGELDFSPDGTRLAAANVDAGTVHVYDFDTATGVISGKQIITGLGGAYGVEFSTNSQVLYASRGGNPAANLYQFDLSVGVPATAAGASATFASAARGFEAIELGPDGRLYVAQATGSHTAVNGIDTISFPDVVGTGAGHAANPGVFPAGSASTSGLPNQFTCSVAAFNPAPVVEITGPAEGSEHPFGAEVPATFACSDTDLVSCTAVDDQGNPIESGDLIDTSTPGPHTITVTGTDAGGNVTVETVTYTVGPNPCPENGLQVGQPPHMPPGSKPPLASGTVHKVVEPVVGAVVDPIAAILGLQVRPLVHQVNCQVVEPVEDVVDVITIPVVTQVKSLLRGLFR